MIGRHLIGCAPDDRWPRVDAIGRIADSDRGQSITSISLRLPPHRFDDDDDDDDDDDGRPSPPAIAIGRSIKSS